MALRHARRLAKLQVQPNPLTNIITIQESIGLGNSCTTHSEACADGFTGIAVHRGVILSASLGRSDRARCGCCVDSNNTE